MKTNNVSVSSWRHSQVRRNWSNFFQVLSNCHLSVKFNHGNRGQWSAPLSWNAAPWQSSPIETKVFIKPTNTNLLLHYQSHVDMQYKRGLLRTIWSSCWSYLSEECDRLKAVFTRLWYPQHLIITSVSYFEASKAEGPQQILSPRDSPTVRIVLPFTQTAQRS